MAIQQRRGANADFDASKMLPGELAVTTDGSRKLYVAFAPGDVKELVSAEEVQKIVDEFDEDVSGEIEKAKEEIEQKKEEVLEDIPDYKKQIAELGVYKANSILCTTSGETILTTDCAAVPPINIKLFGKSMQKQYEGYQLLNIENPTTVYESTHKKVDNNTFQVVTIATNQEGTYCYTGFDYDISEFEGMEYLTFTLGGLQIIGSATPRVVVQAIKPDESYVVYTNMTEAGTVKIPLTNVQAVKLRFYANAGAVCAKGDGVIYTDVMLNKGDALPYEPYTGKAQSPSIDYPQKVTPIGEGGSVNEWIHDNNLIPYPYVSGSNITLHGITYTEEKGVIKATGVPDSINTDYYLFGSGYDKGEYVYLPKGNYKFSHNESSLDNYERKNAFIGFRTLEKGTLLGLYPLVSALRTTDLHIYGIFFICNEIGETYNLSIAPIITLGESTEFIPRSETQNVALQTPNGLHGIPLGKTIPDEIKNSPIHLSGVYWDEVEQQYYIGDTKNENGKDVQRVLECDNSQFSATGFTGEGYRISYRASSTPKYAGALCTHLMLDNTKSQYSNAGDYIQTLEGALKVRFLQSFDSFDACRNYLNENNIKFYMVLAEPIITDTSEEDQAQYNAVHMNYPNTAIVNDAGAYMEVEYVCDTKEHIKQNYVPVSEFEDLKSQVAEIQAQMLNS